MQARSTPPLIDVWQICHMMYGICLYTHTHTCVRTYIYTYIYTHILIIEMTYPRIASAPPSSPSGLTSSWASCIRRFNDTRVICICIYSTRVLFLKQSMLEYVYTRARVYTHVCVYIYIYAHICVCLFWYFLRICSHVYKTNEQIENF